MGTRTRLGAIVAAGAGLLAGAWAPLGIARPATAQDDGLAALRVNLTTWELDDQVVITGLDCDDPDTGSGAGLSAVARLVSFPGSPTFGEPAAVAADGSFTIGPVPISQPVFGGPATLGVACVRALGTPQESAFHPFATVDVTIVAPDFAFPEAADVGAKVAFPAPCTIGAGDQLLVELLPLFATPRYFLERFATRATVGETLTLQLPTQADNEGYRLVGEYHVRAQCEHSPGPDGTTVGNVYAVFGSQPFRLDAPQLEPGPPVTTPASPRPAPPAAPIPGTGSYTG